MKLDVRERLLEDSGFKKKWLSDKSGYWWEKKINKRVKFYADTKVKKKRYYFDIKGDEPGEYATIYINSFSSFIMESNSFKFNY